MTTFHVFLVQLLVTRSLAQQEYCLFVDSAEPDDPTKDGRPYYGTFVKNPSLIHNGDSVYSRAEMYDTGILWIAKHGSKAWILTEYEPPATPIDIIATCICDDVFNCNLENCQYWYWGEQFKAISSELLPSVTIQNRMCEYCEKDDDCNRFRAEICSSNTCVHVGWITLVDHKKYVLETDGFIGVPIQRYGFPKHIKLPASVTWKVVKGTTDTDNKDAVYFYDLSIEEQEAVINSIVGGPHYDFTTENPNSTKNWKDKQLGSVEITVEIHDDDVFETEFAEFQIQIFPKENAILKQEDLDITSVIIIGPNSGNRGVIQFLESQYQVYEQQKMVQIPVQRINGSDGKISVEYSVLNKKLPQTATFGRDYKEFGVWERILHHECDYLQPLRSLQPTVTNLMSAQRYFDIIAKSRYKNGSKFSSNDFVNTFNSKKHEYQYPKGWSKGFGCCCDTRTDCVYPAIYKYEWLQFKLEWPLDDTIKYDQIWAQMELPTFYNTTIVTNHHPADISLIEPNDQVFGPNGLDITPKYTKSWKGLIQCDIGQNCIFRSVPGGYEIGTKSLETDPLFSTTYKSEYCLIGPFADSSFVQVNAASLYIKNFQSSGRLHWENGDADTKMINIELIDDDEYEPTEEFTIILSVTPHPNPQYNPIINPNANQATVYIMGPNDVNLGHIGFADYLLYTNEGDLFCIPLIRSGGTDETAYAEYSCEAQTAQDGKATFDNPPDFEWRTPKFGEFMWPSGQNETKCINIYVFKDEIYEEDEDIFCEITMLWSDYSDLKPEEGYMKAAIIINSNDDQMRLDTPWIIANEGDTAKLRITRFGFKGKDVSVQYKTAICNDAAQCKLNEFATPNDFTETVGELLFFANESFSNKTVEIPIISDNIPEETEAFMFFIEKGVITAPIDTSNEEWDEYINATYTYNIYESSAIVWIHGPNDIAKTEFALWNNQNNTKYENVFIWTLNEPVGDIVMELYSIHVARLQDNASYDFECSVKIHCDSHTASAERDFVCNDTTFYWNNNESDIKEFKFAINNDQHWEHEEIFYITLSDPMNGIVRDEHKFITIAIIANDEKNCTGSVEWGKWTNCSVNIGTGIQKRYRMSIEKNPETGIECIQLSESKYCQMIDSSGAKISVTSTMVTLYEGDYDRDHVIITYSLGGTPNFFDEKYAEKLDDDESLDNCVVKLVLTFDDNLDVSATPVYLCWTNTTWAEEKIVTITVEDNEKIDSEDPRKRYIEVAELLSVDPLYNELNKEDIRIEVLVYDDEYCDPDICKRGASPTEYNEIEYEDEIQEVQTNEAEIVVILVLFFCGVFCLIGLLIKKHIENKRQTEYQALEEAANKDEEDNEIKEMEEIARMEQYLARQDAKKKKKREKQLRKDVNGPQERKSLLLNSSTSQTSDQSEEHLKNDKNASEFSDIQTPDLSEATPTNDSTN